MLAVQVIALNFWMSHSVGLSLSSRSTKMKFSFPTAAPRDIKMILLSDFPSFFSFPLFISLNLWCSTWHLGQLIYTTTEQHTFILRKQTVTTQEARSEKTRISEPAWHSKIWGCELRKVQNKVQGCAFAKISVISQRCWKVGVKTRVGSHQAARHIWEDTDRNEKIFRLSLCARSPNCYLTLSQRQVCLQLLHSTEQLQALPLHFHTDLIMKQECAWSYLCWDCVSSAKFAHPDKLACSWK